MYFVLQSHLIDYCYFDTNNCLICFIKIIVTKVDIHREVLAKISTKSCTA